MESYKNKVFVGYDTEHLSNQCSSLPFAVGFAALVYNGIRFEILPEFSMRLLIEIDTQHIEDDTY